MVDLRSSLKQHGLWLKLEKKSWRAQFEELSKAIAVFNSEYRTLTFWRGIPSYSYDLRPTLYRDESWSYEQREIDKRVDGDVYGLMDMFEVARQYWSPSYPPFHASSKIERLAVMQHHGVATPLLDLTADPFVALWFACEPTTGADTAGTGSRHGGALLAFTFPTGFKPTAHWDDNAGRTHSWYRPPAIDSRIVSQRSVFLVTQVNASGTGWPFDVGRLHLPPLPSAWSKGSLSRMMGDRGRGRPEAMPPLAAIEVPAGSKNEFRRVLSENYGISRESLFPDLGGIAPASS